MAAQIAALRKFRKEVGAARLLGRRGRQTMTGVSGSSFGLRSPSTSAKCSCSAALTAPIAGKTLLVAPGAEGLASSRRRSRSSARRRCGARGRGRRRSRCAARRAAGRSARRCCARCPRRAAAEHRQAARSRAAGAAPQVGQRQAGLDADADLAGVRPRRRRPARARRSSPALPSARRASASSSQRCLRMRSQRFIASSGPGHLPGAPPPPKSPPPPLKTAATAAPSHPRRPQIVRAALPAAHGAGAAADAHDADEHEATSAARPATSAIWPSATSRSRRPRLRWPARRLAAEHRREHGANDRRADEEEDRQVVPVESWRVRWPAAGLRQALVADPRVQRSTAARMPPAKSPALNAGVMASPMMWLAARSGIAPSSALATSMRTRRSFGHDDEHAVADAAAADLPGVGDALGVGGDVLRLRARNHQDDDLRRPGRLDGRELGFQRLGLARLSVPVWSITRLTARAPAARPGRGRRPAAPARPAARGQPAQHRRSALATTDKGAYFDAGLSKLTTGGVEIWASLATVKWAWACS